jgi:hypothetical protein
MKLRDRDVTDIVQKLHERITDLLAEHYDLQEEGVTDDELFERVGDNSFFMAIEPLLRRLNV